MGPDLLGKAITAGAGNRILSQLEHGVAPALAGPPPQRRHAAWQRPAGAVLGVTLIIALGLAWHAWDDTALPTPKPPAVTSAMAAVAPAVLPHSPPSSPAAATIINEAAVAPAAAPHITPAAPHTTLRKPPPSERQKAARAPASRPAAATATTGDSDVALLTAMVAHANRQDGGRTEMARDVVMRKDEEETASLLQRCKQLGLIEGMLCRSRICSGRWESDPACH